MLHGHLDAVQQHVGDAEQMRQRFFFHAGERSPVDCCSSAACFNVVFADVFDGAGEKAAGAAGGIEDASRRAGIDLLDHELGDGARGVIFAGIAGALEVAQELLVDVAEQVAVLSSVEIDPR